ncbi:hexokinase [Wallemia mellicola CBS 633.66]|uniref:Phosphotransferase n=1 Tax=Wallemia mellicola (strain ATCC MYA-4683 / CBS 633.66) TaxID=671144 RepID=I4YGE8_WALMC|nr:hexokinase [Wallemia mellicola CBS 633.66]EIM23040.1 hexokinase [Wallemia mellicola CBS 633.66]|eukprot:XP_006957076.1 hexokinase [Wallemia mellicola CBS 633.66]
MPEKQQRRQSSSVPRKEVASAILGASAASHTRSNETGDVPHAIPSELEDHYQGLCEQLTVSPARLRLITNAFVKTLRKGLAEPGQTVPMIPTYVFGYPTGEEKGNFIALDLGGTNLRVCHVELKGGGKFEVTQSKYRLTEEQKQEDGQSLFDFCAQCLMTFLKDNFPNGTPEGMALGFTFSYPTLQDRIDQGVLVRWTKGFGNKGVEGKDVTEIFNRSLKKYECPLSVTAIINDTTGTMIASRYTHPNTRIGLILGTGCNAAFMDRMSNITKLNINGCPGDEKMAINCEYGAFDSFEHKHLPRTKYDEVIDLTSNKPHEQAYEKMIAGLYLGEVFRLIICEMVDEGVIFLGQETYKIEQPFIFQTAFLSLMESDTTDEQLLSAGLFLHFFDLTTTQEERHFFKKLAGLIGLRAARLSACGIAAIVTHKGIEDDGCDVAVDGSLYEKYPGYADKMHAALVDILGERGRKVVSRHAEDGSGVGCAIIAAMTKARKDAGKYADF